MNKRKVALGILSSIALTSVVYIPAARANQPVSVFKVAETHAPVVRELGSVSTYVCVNATNWANVGEQAIENLRAAAGGRGATDVVDVSERLRQNGPRDPNCPSYVFAKGHAAVLRSTPTP